MTGGAVKMIVNAHLLQLQNLTLGEINFARRNGNADAVLKFFIQVCRHLDELNNWYSFRFLLISFLLIVHSIDLVAFIEPDFSQKGFSLSLYSSSPLPPPSFLSFHFILLFSFFAFSLF